MANYIRRGNYYKIMTEDALEIESELPAGNYSVQMHPLEGLILDKVTEFELPEKLYGDTEKQAKRIWSTFRTRGIATGVLLSGEKGSGKTLLAKKICVEAAKQNVPTIIISTQYKPDELNVFLQSIDQPCVILFDEFEKTFDNDAQEGMLTLLDGTFASQFLFIFTCNDEYKVNHNMINRPGRIFYSINFINISKDTITAYCNDRLDDKTQIPKICKLASCLTHFNFDQLQALVEEMNRYKEDVFQALEMLNIKPDRVNDVYDIEVFLDGVKIEDFSPDEIHQSPLSIKNNFQIGVWEKNGKKDADGEDDTDYNQYQLKPADLEKFDIEKQIFVFKVDKYTVTFKLRQNIGYNFKSLLA